jgi:hypothetical protein
VKVPRNQSVQRKRVQPESTRIGQIRMPFCQRLFMTSSTSFYAVDVETRGGLIGG